MPEFTGERLVPGQVDIDLLNEHLARYIFAVRLARGKRVLTPAVGPGTVRRNWRALPTP